jgi:hypothetical protein
MFCSVVLGGWFQMQVEKEKNIKQNGNFFFCYVAISIVNNIEACFIT